MVVHRLLWGRATWSTTASRVLNTATLVVGRSSTDRVSGGSGGIDAKRNPAKQTVLNCVSEKHILHERVGSRGLLQENAILRVGRQGLRVDGIGTGSLDLRDQVLVEKDLADVRRGQVEQRVVGSRGGVEVDQDVDVVRSSGVVARNEGVEEHDTIVVGFLDTTKEGGVEVGGIGRGVAVAIGRDTRVHTGRVAVYFESVLLKDISTHKSLCVLVV